LEPLFPALLYFVINQEKEKAFLENRKRDRITHKKRVIILYKLCEYLDCGFKLSFKWNKSSNLFEFNENYKKISWTHNHSLDYQGISEANKKEVFNYMHDKELDLPIMPKELKLKLKLFCKT